MDTVTTNSEKQSHSPSTTAGSKLKEAHHARATQLKAVAPLVYSNGRRKFVSRWSSACLLLPLPCQMDKTLQLTEMEGFQWPAPPHRLQEFQKSRT